MSTINVFVSFDLQNDKDLYEQLLAQSSDPSLGFEVSGRSESPTRSDPEGVGVRRRICNADQVVVICGEQTDASPAVLAELRIAQEEDKPYFLLWGRREVMCTKPGGAKTSEGMYSWTPQILQDQMGATTRNAQREAMVSAARRPPTPNRSTGGSGQAPSGT